MFRVSGFGSGISLLVAVLVIGAPAAAGGCAPVARTTPAPSAPTAYDYEVVAAYPHDPAAFTQGLAYDGGYLYEGTGLVGKSSIRRVDLATGSVLQSLDLPPPYFGEGITIMRDRLFQVTWQSNRGFVYDRSTFKQVGSFTYDGEGWGLTNDGKSLIMSSGTANLTFVDVRTFRVTKTVEVRGGPPALGAMRLNELEYVDGKVYANVWLTDYIVIIDPESGEVTGWVSLAGILKDRPADPDAVLNGIAYDSKKKGLFVTGKLWPELFEIELVSAAG